jgi:hypothetical protein
LQINLSKKKKNFLQNNVWKKLSCEANHTLEVRKQTNNILLFPLIIFSYVSGKKITIHSLFCRYLQFLLSRCNKWSFGIKIQPFLFFFSFLSIPFFFLFFKLVSCNAFSFSIRIHIFCKIFIFYPTLLQCCVRFFCFSQ